MPTKTLARRVPWMAVQTLLGIGRTKLQGLVEKDVFSVQRDDTAKGGTRYFFEDELELYLNTNAAAGPDAARAAVRALRIELGRMILPKR
jgi:hypothetical protein